MDERSKIKEKTWIFVIIFIILIGLGLFSIRYIFKNKKSIKTNDNIFSEYPQNNDDSTISFELNDLLNETNVNLNENFKDKEFKYKNKKLYYYMTCIDYNEDYLNSGEKYACRAVQMQIQFRLYRLFTNPNNCQKKIYIISFKDYIVEHIVGDCENGCGTINVYNEGDLLTTVKNVNANQKLTNNSDYNYVKKVDNYLYFFEDIGNYTYLNKLDINDSNYKKVKLEKITNENLSCENINN